MIMTLLTGAAKPSSNSSSSETSPSNFVSKCTAGGLIRAGITNHCLAVLKNLLGYWKSKSVEETGVKVGSSLLKVRPAIAPMFQ